MSGSTTLRGLSALGVPLALAVASATVATGWTGPDRVAWLTISSQPDGPSLAVEDGDRYLAVAGTIRSPGIRLLTDRSGPWRSVRLTEDEAGAPSIAVGDHGAVHIAYARDWFQACTGNCAEPLYHLTRRDGDWHRERLLGGINVMPSIGLDTSGRPHIAVLHRTIEGSDWSIQLLSRTRDGWSRSVIDSQIDYGSLEHPNGPRIAIRGEGVAISYLASPTPSTYELRLYEREGDGAGTRTAISHNQRARWSDLAFDGDGRLHIAYSARGGALWHATRDGQGAWMRTRVSTHVLESARPSLVAWGSGRLAIAIEHDPVNAFPVIGSGDIELLTKRGGQWASEQLTHAGQDHLPAIAATGDGRLTVTFLRDPKTGPATAWFMSES